MMGSLCVLCTFRVLYKMMRWENVGCVGMIREKMA